MYAGVFDRLPDNLLHTFILSLQPEDRLSLFKTSKWLAGAVLRSKPCVKLSFKPEPEHSSWDTVQDTPLMAQLLAGCTDFNVTLLAVNDSPPNYCLRYPHGLARHITRLTLARDTFSLDILDTFATLITPIDWSALTSLQHLCCINIGIHGMSRLFKGLQTKDLPQLRAFTCKKTYPHPDIARVLAAKVQQLTTDVGFMVLMSSSFSWMLRVLSVENCSILDHEARALVEHPRLRDVTITGRESYLSGEHIHRKCSWQTLTLDGYIGLKVLARLPLDSLHDISLVGEVCPLNFKDKDKQTLTFVLKHHSSRLVCKPHEGRFTLTGLSDDAVQLITHLQGPCELQAHYAPADLLQSLCAALPACVHTLTIHHPQAAGCQQWSQIRYSETAVNAMDWCTFWLALPNSISSIGITWCHVAPHALQDMVRTTPLYVKHLTLSAGVWKPDVDQTLLRSIAPGHVTLVLR